MLVIFNDSLFWYVYFSFSLTISKPSPSIVCRKSFQNIYLFKSVDYPLGGLFLEGIWRIVSIFKTWNCHSWSLLIFVLGEGTTVPLDIIEHLSSNFVFCSIFNKSRSDQTCHVCEEKSFRILRKTCTASFKICLNSPTKLPVLWFYFFSS